MFREEIVFAERIEKEIDELLREKVETVYCPAQHSESIISLRDTDKGVLYESVDRQNERVITISATLRDSSIHKHVRSTDKMYAGTLGYSNHNYYTLQTIKSRFIFSSKLERILKRIHKKLEASAHKKHMDKTMRTIKYLTDRMDAPKGTCTQCASKPKLARYDLGSSDKYASGTVGASEEAIGYYSGDASIAYVNGAKVSS